MAVYTDILVAHASEAKAILASEAHNQEWHSLEAKGLDLTEMAGLLSVFSDHSDQPDLVDEFPVEAEEDTEHGPWVHRIPDRLIDHLASLDDPEVEHVARRWAEEAGVPPYMVERTTPPSSGSLLAKLFGRSRAAAVSSELERYRNRAFEDKQWALTELHSLARTAKAEGKQLLLWIPV